MDAPQHGSVSPAPGAADHDPVTWFTLFLLIVSFFQWRAMLGQLKHMENGLSETRASIAEATRSARAAEGIAESMKMNVAQLQAALAVNKRIADTQEKSLKLLNQQWLDVGNWTGKLVEFTSDGQPLRTGIAIEFSITNPSAMPVTLTRVTMGFRKAGQDPVASDIHAVLGPGRSWLYTFSLYVLESTHEYRLSLTRGCRYRWCVRRVC
jgi:hypothetical protein